MPTDNTRTLLDAFWAESFGCAAEVLRANRVTVVAHTGEFASYSGTYMLRYGPACICTVPRQYLELTSAAVRDKPPDTVFTPTFLLSTFAGMVERIVGPSYRGCADASDFHPVDPRGTRLLGPHDDAALRQLAADCGAEAWEHSSIKFGRIPIFGAYAGTTLAAAGSLYLAGTRLRNVGIVTSPAFRGHGYGRAVVSAMSEYALAHGDVPHYQTLLSNAPSLGIARSLGFQQYATGLAARFVTDSHA